MEQYTKYQKGGTINAFGGIDINIYQYCKDNHIPIDNVFKVNPMMILQETLL